MPSDLKNFVVGSSLASGTVSEGASVLPGAAVAPAADDAGRSTPPLVTFHPGGSWMFTWPAEIVFDVDGSALFALPPQPAAARTTTSTAAGARREVMVCRCDRPLMA